MKRVLHVSRNTDPMPQKDASRSEWPLIEATTLADRVYHMVRNRILHRELTPGSFIREQDVSQAMGVSRTPVREALNRLASQDFLERVPHRGFRVPDGSWESLLEVYPIVTALEVLAGTLAFPRLTPADIEQLREFNAELEEAGARGDAKREVEMNNAFHHVLSARSGNQKLNDLLDQLRSQVVLLDLWYFSLPEHTAASVREHEEIIQSIEAREFERALGAIETNYIRGRHALEEELKRKNAAPVAEDA